MASALFLYQGPLKKNFLPWHQDSHSSYKIGFKARFCLNYKYKRKKPLQSDQFGRKGFCIKVAVTLMIQFFFSFLKRYILRNKILSRYHIFPIFIGFAIVIRPAVHMRYLSGPVSM